MLLVQVKFRFFEYDIRFEREKNIIVVLLKQKKVNKVI